MDNIPLSAINGKWYECLNMMEIFVLLGQKYIFSSAVFQLHLPYNMIVETQRFVDEGSSEQFSNEQKKEVVRIIQRIGFTLLGMLSQSVGRFQRTERNAIKNAIEKKRLCIMEKRSNTCTLSTPLNSTPYGSSAIGNSILNSAPNLITF